MLFIIWQGTDDTLGVSGEKLGVVFASVIAFSLMISPQVFGQEDTSEWTIKAGDDLLNDPLVKKILENIEISKQKIAELENQERQLTDDELFIIEQRKIANQILEKELQAMKEHYEKWSPRAAYERYVDKKPAFLHEFYWDQFEYLDKKINFARHMRDQVIENGGSREYAVQVFRDYAKFPYAERIQVYNELVAKHQLYNAVAGKLDPMKEYSEQAKKLYHEWTGIDLDKQRKEIRGAVEEPATIPQIVQVVEPKAPSGPAVETVYISSILDEGNEISLLQNFEAEPQAIDNSMHLDGNDFEVINTSEQMDQVSAFTISAWVKPDYTSKNSAEFVVLSKSNAFTLLVNNIYEPKGIAKFTVFDGIKWTTVYSKSTIPEEWTHVAATLDDSSITIFVNGKPESTAPISGIPTMNAYGFLETKSVDTISSDEEILVGAQHIVTRSDTKMKGFFYGLIDDVVIEDELLAPIQINELYTENERY